MDDIENKKYISTKEAAKLTGYTSDYVGQLARAKKIPSKMVGRARFVEKESLVSYSKRVAQNGELGGRKPHTKPSNEVELFTESNELKKAPASHVKPLSAEFLREKKDVDVRPVSFKKEKTTFFVPNDFFNRATALLVAVVLVSSSFVLFTMHEDTILSLLPSTIASPSVTEKISSVQNVWSEVDEFVIVGLDASAQNALDGLDVVSNLIGVQSASSVLANIGWKIYNALYDATVFIAGLFPSPEIEVDRYVVVTETPGLQDEGIVVVPPDFEKLSYEERVDRIQESFSDEVLVEEDEDGRSGIIKPVFRTQEGESFLYVLVPVEDE